MATYVEALGQSVPRDVTIALRQHHRQAAWRRQGERCLYCTRRLALPEVTADHRHPRIKGGSDEANAAQRERIRAAWERRQEKKRQAGERAFARSMNAANCGLCGSPVEIWRVRKPRYLSTCSTCERPVQAQHYPSFGTSGWASQREGGPSKAMQSVLRSCLVALWHLDHPDRRPA